MHGSSWTLALPTIQLHCESPDCAGLRFFTPLSEPRADPGKVTSHFVTYVCRNCGKSPKTYAFRAGLAKNGDSAECHKFGEDPPFGPPTPAKLITLLGPGRDYFLKGRRAENLGLGIAAFAYYRRVLDNQRVRVIDEIVRVAEKLGANADMLEDLARARSETQFSKAVEAVKHGIPEALLVDGHNPLLLLHAALSEGLHAQTDTDCLELATSIRVVLSELVERMAVALKEEAELKSAVTRLLAVRTGTAPPSGE